MSENFITLLFMSIIVLKWLKLSGESAHADARVRSMQESARCMTPARFFTFKRS